MKIHGLYTSNMPPVIKGIRVVRNWSDMKPDFILPLWVRKEAGPPKNAIFLQFAPPVDAPVECRIQFKPEIPPGIMIPVLEPDNGVEHSLMLKKMMMEGIQWMHIDAVNIEIGAARR